jgi:hypothetical protein
VLCDTSPAQIPAALRILIECLPLHHGVALMRALSVGDIGAGMVVHIGYFVAMVAIGLWLTTKRLGVLLLPSHSMSPLWSIRPVSGTLNVKRGCEQWPHAATTTSIC